MAYNVSLDFRTVHPILTDEAPAIFEWANIGRVTLTNGGAAFPYGHKVTAMMHGFLTAGNAKSKGDELKKLLTLSGAVGPVGIEVTSEPEVIDNLPKPGMVPGMTVNATATTRWRHETFTTKISAMADYVAHATDRQMTSASLINDSFFVVGAESQFILRISAVEALCDQPTQNPNVLKAIANLKEHLKTCALEDDEREALESMLRNAARRSVGQSYKTKLRECGMGEQVKTFEKLYKKRSNLVHDGKGRGDLGEANDKALNIATALLESDVKREAQEQAAMERASHSLLAK